MICLHNNFMLNNRVSSNLLITICKKKTKIAKNFKTAVEKLFTFKDHIKICLKKATFLLCLQENLKFKFLVNNLAK